MGAKEVPAKQELPRSEAGALRSAGEEEEDAGGAGRQQEGEQGAPRSRSRDATGDAWVDGDWQGYGRSRHEAALVT